MIEEHHDCNKILDELFQKILDQTGVQYGQVIIKIDVECGKYKRAEITHVNRFIPNK